VSICVADAQASALCPGYDAGAALDGDDDVADSLRDVGPADADAEPPCKSLGALRCSGRGLQKCYDGGAWIEIQACPVACNEGACITAKELASTTGDSDCALMSDGTVRCWGDNSTGQLGDGTKKDRLPPVEIPELRGAIAISLGYQHGCAILADRSVACWGSNVVGQLGDGTFAEHLKPAKVVPAISARSVAVSTGSCAALVAGGVACWGDKRLFGATADISSPRVVDGIADLLDDLGASAFGACARDASRVRCWGIEPQNFVGSVPTVTFPPRSTDGSYQRIAMSSLTVYGVRVDGVPECWGHCRISAPAPVDWPPIESPEWSGVGMLTVGGRHVCGIFAPGFVRCAGSNSDGQLGNGAGGEPGSDTPADVVALPRAGAVVAGARHTCAITGSGEVYCWGRSPGDPAHLYVTQPRAVSF
jgi:hypothetical protein